MLRLVGKNSVEDVLEESPTWNIAYQEKDKTNQKLR